MKNIIYLICAFLIACGSAPGTDLYGTSKVDSVGGFFNSSGGRLGLGSAGSSGNGSSGALSANGGVFNGSGGQTSLNSGGALNANAGGSQDSGAGAPNSCKTCTDIAVELGGNKACGIVDNGCQHFIGCGSDCNVGKYDTYYASCGVRNGSWVNGIPTFTDNNKNLCGLSCVSVNMNSTDGYTGHCSTVDGIPTNSALPIEVVCEYVDNNPPLPYAGCKNVGTGPNFTVAFCCPIN